MRTAAVPGASPERVIAMLAMAAVAASIGWAAWARHSEPAAGPERPLAAERLLRFQDLPDGRIRVVDASTGQAVQTIEGEAGFARGTLRSLMRERRRAGIAADLPLALRAYRDGRITLADPSTGQRIELEAFGPTNVAVYAHMLSSPGELK